MGDGRTCFATGWGKDKFGGDGNHQAGIVAWGIGCGGSTPGVYAAVSEAVCWIDMVTSCNTVDNAGQFSQFGYLASECGSWVSDTKKRLEALPARVRTVLEGAYNFDQCQVRYEESTYLDLSDFARIANKTGR